MAAIIRTTIGARALLDLCLSIERERGRVRDVRWGPRSLDVDVLTYGAETIDEPGLVIPHPRLAERAFVLLPVAQIAPDLRIAGTCVRELAERIDPTGVERLGPLD